MAAGATVITPMTNDEIIKRVTNWQKAGFVHELTCGRDSRHEALVAKEVNGSVVLVCPTCAYVQNHIPQVCLSGWVEQHQEALRDKGDA